jgi:hypothetical protein
LRRYPNPNAKAGGDGAAGQRPPNLLFLGRLNDPPRWRSVPVVTVMAGQTYNYTTTAVDPNNDFLEFSVVSGPPNLAFTDSHAGTLTWTKATIDVGTYPVRLRISDNNGGTADQAFILSVVPSGVNYPPVFTSTPGGASSSAGDGATATISTQLRPLALARARAAAAASLTCS